MSENTIKFECPSCGQSIEAPTAMLGMEVECPGCAKKVKVQTSKLPDQKPETRIPLECWRVAMIFIVAFPLLVGGVYLGNRLSQPRKTGWMYIVDVSASPDFKGENQFKEASGYAEGITITVSNGWELVGFIQAADGNHAVYRIQSSIAEKQVKKLEEEMAKHKPQAIKSP